MTTFRHAGIQISSPCRTYSYRHARQRPLGTHSSIYRRCRSTVAVVSLSLIWLHGIYICSHGASLIPTSAEWTKGCDSQQEMGIAKLLRVFSSYLVLFSFNCPLSKRMCRFLRDIRLCSCTLVPLMGVKIMLNYNCVWNSYIY